MNIDNFQTESQLIEIKLDSDDIKTKYGEDIVFWTQSHPKLTTYFNFFEARVNGDYARLETIMRELILDSQGQPAIKPEKTLPADIFTAAILAIGERLGKSMTAQSN